MFVGSAGATGGAISCEGMNLIITNCEFSLTEQSKPAAAGAFIHYKNIICSFTSTDIIFDTSHLQVSTSVSIIDTSASRINFMNTHIICPKALSVVEEIQAVDYYMYYHYKCNKHCKDNEYTYKAGNAVVQGKSNGSENQKVTNLLFMSTEPSCSASPIGAYCDKCIQALPN